MNLNCDQIRDLLREECRRAGGQKQWAEANHISSQYLSDCLRGRREIGISIARALGYIPERVYIPVSQDVGLGAASGAGLPRTSKEWRRAAAVLPAGR